MNQVFIRDPEFEWLAFPKIPQCESLSVSACLSVIDLTNQIHRY